MKKSMWIFGVALLVILGCAKKVLVDKRMPAQLDIQGIEKVAVADFDGLYHSGRIISSKVAAGIVDAGHYRLFEREKFAEILAEHDLYDKDVGIDPATTRKLRLHGVDALIFGVVDAYNITDQRGTSVAEKKVGTGRYRKAEYKDPKTGETKYREEEIMKTVLWNRPYIVREGTLGVTFRMANVSTGEIVAVEAMTSNFAKKAWEDQISRNLPSREEILDNLASEVVQRFLHKVQPYTIRARIEFEKMGGSHNKLAIVYAKNGLWDKALAEFNLARQEKEDNPSAHYNLAMVYYVLGNHGKALTLVEKAITLKPKEKYIEALGMIRRDMEI